MNRKIKQIKNKVLFKGTITMNKQPQMGRKINKLKEENNVEENDRNK